MFLTCISITLVDAAVFSMCLAKAIKKASDLHSIQQFLKAGQGTGWAFNG